MRRLFLAALLLALPVSGCRVVDPAADYRELEIAAQDSPLPLDPAQPEFQRFWRAAYDGVGSFSRIKLAEMRQGLIKSDLLRLEEAGRSNWYWAVARIRRVDEKAYEYWVRVYRLEAPRDNTRVYDSVKTRLVNERISWLLEYPPAEPPPPWPWMR